MMRLTREMQLTRDEFLRELPRAIGNLRHTLDGQKVIVGNGERRLEIHLVDEGVRDLGSLHLPMERVDFDFYGYTPGEVTAFMEHFDLHTQRGGG